MTKMFSNFYHVVKAAWEIDESCSKSRLGMNTCNANSNIFGIKINLIMLFIQKVTILTVLLFKRDCCGFLTFLHSVFFKETF